MIKMHCSFSLQQMLDEAGLCDTEAISKMDLQNVLHRVRIFPSQSQQLSFSEIPTISKIWQICLIFLPN